MTDAQFGILISVLTAFGGSLIATARWSVSRITKALDDNTASHQKLADGQIKHAEQLAALTKSVEFTFNASQKAVDFIKEERSGVHEGGAYDDDPPKPKARTNPKGVPIGQWGPLRPKTEGDR